MIKEYTEGKRGGTRVVEFTELAEFDKACRVACGDAFDETWDWSEDFCRIIARGEVEFSHSSINFGNLCKLVWDASVEEMLGEVFRNDELVGVSVDVEKKGDSFYVNGRGPTDYEGAVNAVQEVINEQEENEDG